jgi:hypothetical protein
MSEAELYSAGMMILRRGVLPLAGRQERILRLTKVNAKTRMGVAGRGLQRISVKRSG